MKKKSLLLILLIALMLSFIPSMGIADQALAATSAKGRTGLVKQSGSWVYLANGKIDKNYTNLVKYNGSWFYVKNGRLDFRQNTLAQVNRRGTWYRVKNSRIDWGYTGLQKFGNTWYYIKKGRVDWSYTGLVKYNGSWFYVRKGKLDWGYTGNVTYGGSRYFVKNGRMIRKITFVPLHKLQCYSQYVKKYMSESQFQAAYNAASAIVEKAQGKPRKDQLQIIASELRRLLDEGKVNYSEKASHYNDPYGYLVAGNASCAGCARTVRMCLNMLGISCEHVHENRYCHQWVRVPVNNTYWICDPYGLYVGEEPAPYQHPYFN